MFNNDQHGARRRLLPAQTSPWGLVAALLLALAFALSACSSTEKEEDACSIDSDCARGTVCVDDACAEVNCLAAIECPDANQGCTEDGLCSALECFSDGDCTVDGLGDSCIENICTQGGSSGGCSSDIDCPAGQVCTNSACVPDSGGCTSDIDCPVGQVCGDAGACVPETNTGTTGDTGTTGTTGTSTTPSGAALCAPCQTDNDCGGEEDLCSPIRGGNFCTVACNTADECPSGFVCDQISTTSPRQCLPGSGASCDGCFNPETPCGAGQVCDPQTTQCRTPENCAACNTDAQCGEGRCYNDGALRVCGLPCGPGNTCDSGFECTNVLGVDICVTTDECGQTGSCENAPTCGGDRPFLNEDFCQCVECGSTADCAALPDCNAAGGCVCSEVGSCIVASQTCQGPDDCANPNPYCQGGFCVQCFGNQDCPNQGDQCIRGACQTCQCPAGQTCNAQGQCIEGGSCTTDSDCIAQDLFGPVEGRCSQFGTCYNPGQCGASDPFNSTCPTGLTCEPDLLGFGTACGGCTAFPTNNCRPGEDCVPRDLLNDPFGPTICIKPLF